MTTSEALHRLAAGNQRFVATGRGAGKALSPARRAELAAGQRPFAAVLACADSRVAPEVVFDQELGALFVVRVAGNIATPAVVGSIEFAAAEFSTPLVVVLGHSRCGAVTATVEAMRASAPSLSPGLQAIVDRIRPPVESVLADPSDTGPDEIVSRAVRANVRAVVESLRLDSALLADRVEAGTIQIVGAEYDLETGVVEFTESGTGRKE